ncbi:Protein of unknown function [Cognatiyoonia koreensis]|uniref:DUF2852 domain-containing protein n=1 Tax=Cognatiyoonia koreensis TaxID=364200 RepID=A0A1I0NU63_9RHOB|nr:DUF2852 domain-containing protein [Cognatiyoonia koreensis]SEW05276.1 Protein of unknown function [Cognatiyoonia koreensis]
MTIAMNTHYDTNEPPHPRPYGLPVSVQILSTILFGAFAITAIAITFDHSWVAGFILAIVLGWRGGFAPGGAALPSPQVVDAKLRSLVPTTGTQSSGNASFDAYRQDMLARLETEQAKFEGFLGRLRDAKDQSEFDKFMDDRATKLRAEAQD